MSDRAALISGFLAGTAWQSWDRTPLAGDASARRYLRLVSGTQSVILMDAPSHNGEDTRPFVQMATYLTDHDFAAPHILKHDPDLGLVLLSDLGAHDYVRWLAHAPDDEGPIYRAAADVLLRLQTCTPPQNLSRMTPQVGAEMVAIIGPHYTGKPTDDLCAQMKDALATFAPDPTVLALRDFHAENLIWRPDAPESHKVGLLDFQDAFIAPAGYDLASLLRDARRDVSPVLAADMISYFSEATRAGTAFGTTVACLAVQRNLRILGVFARLITTMGKPRYRAFLPRVWGHILHDLQDPALIRLKEAVLDTVPAPNTEKLAELTP